MDSQSKILDRFQIVGFIFSAGISIALLLARQDTIPSVSLGLILAILTQLFDLQIRQTSSEERLLIASEISKKLLQDEWLLEHIREIIDNYVKVKALDFDVFNKRANDSVEECQYIIYQLATKQMVAIPESQYTYGREGFETAKYTCKAIAIANPAPYWRTATTYLKVNEDAVKRGVSVIRVFIQPHEVLIDIVDILEKQRSIGVQVYVAEPANLPSQLVADTLIVDDKIFARSELTNDSRIRDQIITIDPIVVRKAVHDFGLLLRRSKKLEDVIEQLKQAKEKT